MIWFIILKKELKSYLFSPLFWILAALFSLLSGFMFYNLFFHYVENTQNLPPELKGEMDYINHVVLQMISNINMLLLFIVPLVSMRIFSEEKKDYSLDLYFLSGVKNRDLVIGKYLGSILSVLFIISSSLLYPALLKWIGFNDVGVFFSGYLALFFNVLAYLSVGVFASSLTKNQIVAAIISFVLILFSWLIVMGSQLTYNPIISVWFEYLSLITHYEVLSKGLLRTTDLVYYVIFIFFFLFLTKKNLESRNF